MTAAICVYLIAYRFYSKFIAEKVLGLDDSRQTPAYRHNDGMDYVPTNRWVLYGHHFAAIAGAGPLVGPVLAAQMGFLPGTMWILAGVVFAGAVQDFIVLFASVRRDGKSLGEMIKMEMGPVPGGLALVGVLAIMIIILAVLSLVVVKALAESPWGETPASVPNAMRTPSRRARRNVSERAASAARPLTAISGGSLSALPPIHSPARSVGTR